MNFSEYTGAIRKGDRLVFKEYVEQTFDRVFGLVFKMTADKDISEDIVQETYIKIWEKRLSIRKDGSLISWTLKIASNTCLDYLRKRKRYINRISPDSIKELISEKESDDQLRADEAENLLKALTDKLSTRQKAVFTLSVLEGLSADEISEITGLSKERIKSNLYHARREIRKNWEKLYEDE